MIWFFIASIFGLVTGIVLTLLYFSDEAEDWAFHFGLLLTSISGVAFIVSGIYVGVQDNKAKAIEYSADEYRIEYKVTEFQGQRDTTYVLIKKEEKK